MKMEQEKILCDWESKPNFVFEMSPMTGSDGKSIDKKLKVCTKIVQLIHFDYSKRLVSLSY